MKIMVLDDSDDDTVETMSGTVKHYQTLGFDIEHVRRGTRTGYKAGALKHAMKSTKSEFVAIFDADFIPPTWYLKKAMSHFTKAQTLVLFNVGGVISMKIILHSHRLKH